METVLSEFENADNTKRSFHLFILIVLILIVSIASQGVLYGVTYHPDSGGKSLIGSSQLDLGVIPFLVFIIIETILSVLFVLKKRTGWIFLLLFWTLRLSISFRLLMWVHENTQTHFFTFWILKDLGTYFLIITLIAFIIMLKQELLQLFNISRRLKYTVLSLCILIAVGIAFFLPE